MNLFIVLAIVGWALFALSAVLLLVGIRRNSEETNALAIFILALLLDDCFLSATREELNRAATETISHHDDTRKMAYALMEAVTRSSKHFYRSEELNTIRVVMNALARQFQAPAGGKSADSP